MATQTPQTAQQFHDLKISLLNADQDLFQRELALRQLPDPTQQDEQNIAVLFSARRKVQDAIAQERAAEINFLSSPVSEAAAIAAMAHATAMATGFLQQLADLQAAFMAADQILQIVTDLVTVFR